MFRFTSRGVAMFVFVVSATFGMAFTPLGLPALPAACWLGYSSPTLRHRLLGPTSATRWWPATEAGLLLGVLAVVWVFVLPSTSDQVWLALVPLGMLALAGVGFLTAALIPAGVVRDGVAAGSCLLTIYPGIVILIGLAIWSVTAGSEDLNGNALRIRVQVIFLLLTLAAIAGVAAARRQRGSGAMP
jgi:hypothetical protein